MINQQLSNKMRKDLYQLIWWVLFFFNSTEICDSTVPIKNPVSILNEGHSIYNDKKLKNEDLIFAWFALFPSFRIPPLDSNQWTFSHFIVRNISNFPGFDWLLGFCIHDSGLILETFRTEKIKIILILTKRGYQALVSTSTTLKYSALIYLSVDITIINQYTVIKR